MKYFKAKSSIPFRKANWIRAVDNIDFEVRKGDTLGLVGESGCGKTTAGRCILRLIEPTSGKIFFQGQDILGINNRNMKVIRRNLSLVFQDPMSSMNPRMTIDKVVGEPLVVHNLARGEEIKDRVTNLLLKVGLKAEDIHKFPHEFSGGQKQRIVIARALILRPRLVILDEPTSALDVSVQSQILNLLTDLQKEYDLTYLFISHNLAVVEYISDVIAVMYAGKIVEYGNAESVFRDSRHPYTRALLKSVPVPDPTAKSDVPVLGEPPSPINPPSGCRFHPRCPMAMEICKIKEPEQIEVEKNHTVSCFLYG